MPACYAEGRETLSYKFPEERKMAKKKAKKSSAKKSRKSSSKKKKMGSCGSCK
jgi:hypothetical protein